LTLDLACYKSVPHGRIRNGDDDHKQHVVPEVANAVLADGEVITTKITTIVPKITTRITIAQKIPSF